MDIIKFNKFNEASKYKKDKFISTPVEVGKIFLRSNPMSGYYNHLIVQKIEGNDVTVSYCDTEWGGDRLRSRRTVGNPFIMKLKDVQKRIDELDKEKHEKNQGFKEEVYNLSKEIGIDKVKGGDLNSIKVINELKESLMKLKEIGNNFSVKDSSVPAGGFSGANSFSMRSSQSGTAINILYNDVHRGGYYEGSIAFLVQIQVGGAIPIETRKVLLEVSKQLLSKFNYETPLGKSRITQTDGTNWSSVMLTAPSSNNSYSVIHNLSK